MEFRIADTFTDSLAKLTGDEQRSVKTTAFDLQINPASPGLQFHRLERARLQDLDEAVRRYLAWKSVLDEKGEDGLDLSPHQVSQADAQLKSADGVVAARIPETYQWLIVPTQSSPQS